MYTSNKYKDKLSFLETFNAIKFLKDNFENILAKKLNLTRISAPLFVTKSSGLNDNLNGTEKPVSFNVDFSNDEIEIVQSLAKWKRNALKEYNFNLYQGLYSDMNAIRKDEIVDNIHSVYVDQWDWELIIKQEDRNLEFLFQIVNKIYDCFLQLEKMVLEKYSVLNKKLPKEISFISSEELYELYPKIDAKQREYLYTKKNKACFIYKIGYLLKDGKPHDMRAADYDDWNLNGDILVYDEILDCALELSSMGIRVDKDSLLKQLKIKNEEYKISNKYHQDVINNFLPYTIGGGIGQSRLCLFFLEKIHIGQVQASIWSKSEKEKAKLLDIKLL